MPNESPEAQPHIPVPVWLDVFEREYLAEYVPAGGAAVKVVSGTDAALRQLTRGVENLAAQNKMHYAFLDAAKPDSLGRKPDLHRMDKFFFATTANVDWKEWAASQARHFLAIRGVTLNPGREISDLAGIAQDNGREPQDLLNQYQAELATPQIRDFGMAVEFRSAVTALGRVQLVPDSVAPSTEEVLLHWFAGRTIPGASASLKKIQIYERIHQTNARFMLASLCRWLPSIGLNGLTAVLDFRPYEYRKITKTQRQAQENRKLNDAIAQGYTTEELAELQAGFEKEPEVAYTESGYMQMLASIRRFIDEIDWFERFTLIILTTPAYYDALSRRKYTDYDALQTRIGLEVRDAARANPTATLVHLEAAA